MTSRNLLSADTASIPAKEMRKHMLWSEGLTFLLYFLYHVVAVAVVLASAIRTPDSHALTLYASSLLGPKSPVIVLTFIAACVLAFHGFYYLTDRRALDFYESQPVSRNRHFIDVCLHSLTVFGVSFVITMAAGILVTAAMGAFSSWLLPEIAKNIACNVCFFIAVYGICTLAVMLTGNIIVSLLAGAVFFLYEVTFRFILDLLMGEYFKTYADNGIMTLYVWTSPFLHIGKPAAFCLHNIVLGALVFAAAYFCYKIRKNEDAGKAVLFRPVRAVVKIVIAVLPSIFVGYILADSAGVFIACLCAVLAAVITGCVMEIIYDYDFKSLFRHFPETAIAAALGLGILFLFIKDPLGYDRYVPDPAKVESAAILFNDYYTQYYTMENGELVGEGLNEYSARNMKLEDMEAVTGLAGILRDRLENGKAPMITILYRLKSGIEVCRQYRLPADIDPALMDRITGEEAFRNGYFQICNESTAEMFAENGEIMMMYGEHGWKEVQYDEFREAYMKDLRQFSYTFARDHSLVGMASITRSAGFNRYGATSIFECPVYSHYDNTIAFLKKNDLYTEPVKVEKVRELKVRIYDWKINEDSEEAISQIKKQGGQYVEGAVEFTFTDPDVFLQIFPDGVVQYTEGPLGRCFNSEIYMETEAVLTNGDTMTCSPNSQNLPENIRKLISESREE